mmetsp:Transcript_157130/g.277470  ORF Transcript_157130/g.277470 Transcript_157130/m.277470 type:complete len:81 (-) Transcript_157130:2-244(-)
MQASRPNQDGQTPDLPDGLFMQGTSDNLTPWFDFKSMSGQLDLLARINFQIYQMDLQCKQVGQTKESSIPLAPRPLAPSY